MRRWDIPRESKLSVSAEITKTVPAIEVEGATIFVFGDGQVVGKLTDVRNFVVKTRQR